MRLEVTKKIETNSNIMLSKARAKPYLKIAKEPVKPIKERSKGLQKGHVVVKKLMKAPANPAFAPNDFCLFLIAKTCNAIKRPPRIENKIKNVKLTSVKATLIYFNPNLRSIKFVITA